MLVVVCCTFPMHFRVKPVYPGTNTVHLQEQIGETSSFDNNFFLGFLGNGRILILPPTTSHGGRSAGLRHGICGGPPRRSPCRRPALRGQYQGCALGNQIGGTTDSQCFKPSINCGQVCMKLGQRCPNPPCCKPPGPSQFAVLGQFQGNGMRVAFQRA